MRINTNIMALNAQNKLSVNQGKVEKSIQKLSSGMKINSAADDAAGLAISEKMRAQIRGLDQAEANAQDSISLLQTAEGALQQTTDIVQRMRELVIKAQNSGVLTEEDKTSISNELSVLRDEIDRIATSTTFNGKKILNGDLGTKLAETGTTATVAGVNNIDVSNALSSATYKVSVDTTEKVMKLEIETTTGTTTVGKIDLTGATSIGGRVTFDCTYNDEAFKLSMDLEEKTVADWAGLFVDGKNEIKTGNKTTRADFKIGANAFAEDTLSFGIGDMSAAGLKQKYDGTAFSIKISDRKSSDETLGALDYALDKIASQRATIGTMQNRMEYAISNLSTTSENLSAAESRIRDVDMADEMVKYTKNSILNQSAMAMLAQANQQPQAILSLLQ